MVAGLTSAGSLGKGGLRTAMPSSLRVRAVEGGLSLIEGERDTVCFDGGGVDMLDEVLERWLAQLSMAQEPLDDRTFVLLIQVGLYRAIAAEDDGRRNGVRRHG